MECDGNQQKRVLVVEGETVIGRIYQRVLAGRGFSVDIAADGSRAIDDLNNRQYDLCILDIHMPGIKTKQLDEYLNQKRHGRNRNLVLTTDDFRSSRISGPSNDSDRVYLQKPFTPQELISAVENAMYKTS